jgi:hypothetical protein
MISEALSCIVWLRSDNTICQYVNKCCFLSVWHMQHVLQGDKSVSSTSCSGRDQQDRGKLPLLAVDPKRLRGEEEMRRIFGASILREEERNVNAGQQVSFSCSLADLSKTSVVSGLWTHDLCAATDRVQCRSWYRVTPWTAA